MKLLVQMGNVETYPKKTWYASIPGNEAVLCHMKQEKIPRQTFIHPTTDIKRRCQIYPKNETRKLRRFRNHFSSCPTEMLLEKNCEESYPKKTQSTIWLKQLDGDIIIIIIIKIIHSVIDIIFIVTIISLWFIIIITINISIKIFDIIIIFEIIINIDIIVIIMTWWSLSKTAFPCLSVSTTCISIWVTSNWVVWIIKIITNKKNEKILLKSNISPNKVQKKFYLLVTSQIMR